MSPEEKELLIRSVSLGEENNEILRSMRRSQRWTSVVHALYWILIIGSAVGAYVYIQPYTDQIMDMYNTAKENLNSFNETFQGIKR